MNDTNDMNDIYVSDQFFFKRDFPHAAALPS